MPVECSDLCVFFRSSFSTHYVSLVFASQMLVLVLVFISQGKGGLSVQQGVRFFFCLVKCI